MSELVTCVYVHIGPAHNFASGEKTKCLMFTQLGKNSISHFQQMTSNTDFKDSNILKYSIIS